MLRSDPLNMRNILVFILLLVSSTLYANDLPEGLIKATDGPGIVQKRTEIPVKPSGEIKEIIIDDIGRVKQSESKDKIIRYEPGIKKYELDKETDSDLETFKARARSAHCADVKNKLFLIDRELVFWHSEGNCPDASYSLILYDRTNDQVLCSLTDSIAGPRKTINNNEYENLFETIIDNLEKSDLGLSSDHRVEEIPLID